MSNSSTVKSREKISILGCGWYGLELAKNLVQLGYIVKGSSTTADKLKFLTTHQIQPFLVHFKRDEENYDPLFFKSDILFICIPPKRNTAEQADFEHKIERVVAAAIRYKIKRVIFISSTAVYGDLNDEVSELTIPQPETASGNTMLSVENLLNRQTSFTTTIIRFAGLVGPQRLPGRFFAGKTDVPNGQAPINLIHLTDCIGISLAVLKEKAFGHTFNACAPDHPSKQKFYTAAAINMQLTPPEFIDELLNWKKVTTVQSDLLKYNYLVNNWINWVDKDN